MTGQLSAAALCWLPSIAAQKIVISLPVVAPSQIRWRKRHPTGERSVQTYAERRCSRAPEEASIMKERSRNQFGNRTSRSLRYFCGLAIWFAFRTGSLADFWEQALLD